MNNRKKYSIHFGKDDVIVDGIRMNPIHQLPDCEWEENQEIDFYMDDREQIYLLRIRNNDQNSISFYDDDYNPIRYIVVQMRVIDTYESLRQIIRTLKKYNYKDRDNKEIICISIGE